MRIAVTTRSQKDTSDIPHHVTRSEGSGVTPPGDVRV
jgi:hypothetical protein